GAVLLKYDINGNFQWIRNHADISFSANYPLLELDKTGDPYLLFSINTTMGRYEYGIAKYDEFGTQKWLARYSYNNRFCEISDAEIDDDFNLLVTGHCGNYMTTVKWSQIITNISTVSNQIPDGYKLYQNYPNPFNPSTNIQFDLPKDNFATVKIYDLLGKEVTTLINEYKKAGSYVISFNGNNLSSGIYYYSIETGNFNQVRKMILIK
ncbi:MAG: T9SS type A sorting domain-containing protein, partial [Ignavibacteria bacterium]